MINPEIIRNKHFDFHSTTISDLFVLQRKPITDARGFFCRFFCADEFQSIGLTKPIVQINHTYTKKKGTVRGLHFQHPPCAETKIISCLQGEIFDVAVDIRKYSPTFLQWFGAYLSAKNKKSLFIPAGFAHGFQALTRDTEILYLVTAYYNPKKEDALNAQDPMIGIQWPEKITELSDKDKAVPFIDQTYLGIINTTGDMQ
jgi:dTDP-4-dehydrorhamnose 3,5-epimerase